MIFAAGHSTGEELRYYPYTIGYYFDDEAHI